MTEARRALEALSAAQEAVKAAVIAVGKHAHRGPGDPLPQHINDLQQLIWATETMTYLVRDLAEFAKTCADDVRTHYVHGHHHGGSAWPDNVAHAAAHADTALSLLRRRLSKTPVSDSHNALSLLHACVRDARRGSGS
jgi:hypothetical protein